MKAQNSRQAAETESYFSRVIRHWSVRASAFSLWWSAVGAYACLVNISQLVQIYRSQWTLQCMSQTLWCMCAGCVFIC